MVAGPFGFCQSCGSELTEANLGTEANGSHSTDYCAGCFSGGSFRDGGLTLAKMSDQLRGNLTSAGQPEAIVAHRVFGLQNLKRWQHN